MDRHAKKIQLTPEEITLLLEGRAKLPPPEPMPRIKKEQFVVMLEMGANWERVKALLIERNPPCEPYVQDRTKTGILICCDPYTAALLQGVEGVLSVRRPASYRVPDTRSAASGLAACPELVEGELVPPVMFHTEVENAGK